jgi:predicted DNA-binding ribbon-helix-helix protein
MKTTLELPDELFTEAKAMAARRRTTLKALFTRALEKELRGQTSQMTVPGRVIKDSSGWPVLQRERTPKTPVTESFIRGLRDEEGI